MEKKGRICDLYWNKPGGLKQWELKADGDRRGKGTVGKGGSGKTEEWEKYRLEVSSTWKSDVGERLVNIRVQIWEFYAESDDSLFLPLIMWCACLLSTDTTQVSVLSSSILGKLRSSEERREEKTGLRRRRSGRVPVSLNSSHGSGGRSWQPGS